MHTVQSSLPSTVERGEYQLMSIVWQNTEGNACMEKRVVSEIFCGALMIKLVLLVLIDSVSLGFPGEVVLQINQIVEVHLAYLYEET